MPQRTVRELQFELLRQAGLRPEADRSREQFIFSDPARGDLWREVSGVWAKKGLDPSKVGNLDTAIILTEGEYQGYLQRGLEIARRLNPGQTEDTVHT